MAEVTIYGASDDLVEIDGAISEEWNASDDERNYLAFSDGTVLSIEYGSKGCWEIRREKEGTAEYSHTPHDNDQTTYTDRVTLKGDIQWVVCGKIAFAPITPTPGGARDGE
ncbi:hypothetical protein GAU_1806 [Gemmatimonas aurantiaca T-27]|uniref:Uncharacterized protein n=1 Tax=Gemmatimonas aurantiaca (strain DSM 14586 / JCM 11422 / NBRC 100505 / T-27) TaxID=379066 RepID=C1A423_GEMAT|nr:hypothetical protein [Gemmatimonas aurantiaca]BAH38848.1 hypothetical protein GAU_1806 [Gemmatimonas aurantiaca T-27]